MGLIRSKYIFLFTTQIKEIFVIYRNSIIAIITIISLTSRGLQIDIEYIKGKLRTEEWDLILSNQLSKRVRN